MFGPRLLYPAIALVALASAQTADRLKPLPPFPEAFYGKWRLAVDSTPPMSFKRDGEEIEGAVAGRTYRFKLDGHDYATPNQGQMAAWRRTGPRSYETVLKRNGQVLSTSTLEVSADDKTARLTVSSPEASAPSQAVLTRKTASEPNDPKEPLLGAWEVEAPADTFSAAPNGIHWTRSSGGDYTAGFDSREYPVSGLSQATVVSIQKIDDRTMEETRKVRGAVVEKTRIQVSEDGGTIKRTTMDLRSPNAAPLVREWVRQQ